MDPKRQKWVKPSLGVPADGPQKTGCGRKSFLRGWKRGIDGKASSVEGVAPEKVATRPLPLRFACGPLPLMMPRVAHFSGASPSTDLAFPTNPTFPSSPEAISPSFHRLRSICQHLRQRFCPFSAFGVHPLAPQTTVLPVFGVWGPSADTSRDGMLSLTAAEKEGGGERKGMNENEKEKEKVEVKAEGRRRRRKVGGGGRETEKGGKRMKEK